MRLDRQTMTAAELVQARERLGWSRARLADELGVTPVTVEALETGSISVLPDLAGSVRSLEAAYQRQRVLAEKPWGVRVLGRMGLLIGRLPRFLWGPSPARGEYRRFSVVMALLLSGPAVTVVVVNVLRGMLFGEATAGGLRERGILLAAVIPPYFIGCWLAGAAWDATRGIRHRPASYVLRGAATAGALYGAMLLALPLLKDESVGVPVYAAGVAILAVLGALIGAVKWIRDRLTDNLPEPVRD